MGHLVAKSLVAVLLASSLVYFGDWAVWRMRVAAGSGTGQVEVTRVVVASLKGNKEEYFPQGTAIVACSRSLFPQAGEQACWWIARHAEVYER